jgi:glycosyltransferase involved in cell wall biosynthesis
MDDVRVNHKMGQAFRSDGFRVTWVGPEYTFFDPKNYNRCGIEYRSFPRAKGKLGRLLGFYNAYRYGYQIPDVQVFYAPDPDSAMAAVLLSRKHRARAIFDIHEIFHDAMLGRWVKGRMGKVAGTILQQMMLMVCSRCDLVIGVSQAVLEPYRETRTEKMVVRSCAPAWFAENPPSDVCGPGRDTFTLLHGKASLSRGTDIVLKALSLAKKQVPNLRCIMFANFLESVEGYGVDEFRKHVASLNIQDVVDLREGVPMQEMPGILRSCDAGLIAYDRKLGADSLPNKLFEYMAAGLPTIAPEYSPEIRRILETEKCGVTADFENPSSVADAIVRIRQNPEECREMGRRAREAFNKRHNWEYEVRPLLDRIRDWYE